MTTYASYDFDNLNGTQRVAREFIKRLVDERVVEMSFDNKNFVKLNFVLSILDIEKISKINVSDK